MRLSEITGVILAGGQARRMGGIDKGLVELAGVPMCKIVMDLLESQVSEVLLNANRNRQIYEKFGAPVIHDQIEGYLGPLAGLASAMQHVETQWVITAPCDGPFLNHDYVARMSEEVDDGIDVVVASDGKRLQPTFMLVNTKLRQDLVSFLESGGRKIDLWFVKHGYAVADFSNSPNCFLNVNSEEDRQQAEKQILNHELT